MPPHGDDCTGHSHDSEFGDEAALTSLRELIDLPRVTCLNEEAEGTGRAVLRSHGDRYLTEPSLRSTEDPDDEPELPGSAPRLLTAPGSDYDFEPELKGTSQWWPINTDIAPFAGTADDVHVSSSI